MSVVCKVCGRSFKIIAPWHLRTHSGWTMKRYREVWPDAPLFSESVKKKQSDSHKKYDRDHPGVLSQHMRRVSNKIWQDSDRREALLQAREEVKSTRLQTLQRTRETTDVNQRTSRALRRHFAGRPGTFAGHRHTEESKRRNSETQHRKALEGETGYSRGHYRSKKTGFLLFYRSSYELAAFRQLDMDDAVSSFDMCRFSIPYQFEGATHQYRPDIDIRYPDGRVSIVEVKANWAVDLPKNIAKFETARKWCSECRRRVVFEIWTEEDLKLVRVA